MAYYILEDVAKLISFWHRSKQNEIAPCMFIFVHYKLHLFESTYSFTEKMMYHMFPSDIRKETFDPQKENKTKIHCKQVVCEAWGSSA